ncbi:MAG: IS5 family transposase [archaeon]|nr:IS5 family transposase [archaeon]
MNEIKFPYRFSVFSKRMYGNFVHVFLLVYKERLNVSYRRFVQIASEVNLERTLGIKRIPHFTTIQKFLQRIPKKLFESMVKACRRLLNLKKVTGIIDGTGFSNTNPSHYYQQRVDGVKVKNYTKTVLLTDKKTKLVLNIKTHSDNASETLDFIPLVQDLNDTLSQVLGDKGYDSMKNREYCWNNGISVQIPLRNFKQAGYKYGLQPYLKKKRRIASQLFDQNEYRYRVLVESVNSAIKRTLGSWVNSRNPGSQQKQVILKILAYNIEVINRTIKLTIFIT